MLHRNMTFRDELPSVLWCTVFMAASWLIVKASGGFTGDWLLLATPFSALAGAWWRTRHSRRFAGRTASRGRTASQ